VRRCRAVELLGDGRDLRGERDFEVVAATAEVNDVSVMCVAKYPAEEPVAQRLAVAPENLVSTAAKG
jgi:hypothetical protein